MIILVYTNIQGREVLVNTAQIAYVEQLREGECRIVFAEEVSVRVSRDFKEVLADLDREG